MAFTSIFGFELIDFAVKPWSSKEWTNWKLLDKLLSNILKISNLKGSWANSTLYAAGDRVFDDTTLNFYNCAVGHTSAASPTTFSADRIANPSYWTVVNSTPVWRGVWTVGTPYNVLDVVQNGNAYYTCNTKHTSGGIAIDLSKFDLLADFSTTVAAVATYNPNNFYLKSEVDGFINPLTATVATKAPLRNRILNPAFQVNQEFVTGTGPTIGSAGSYVCDGWIATNNTDGTLTGAQVNTAIAPSGSPMRMGFACTVIDATIAAGQYAVINQYLEGLNVADLEWGTANAKSIALRFYVKVSLAGTYGVSVANAANTRSYVQSFTVGAGEVGTDKLVTLVIPGDTTGAWSKDTNIGLNVRIALAAGSTYLTASTGWNAGYFLGITGSQANFMSTTSGSNFVLADVGLYEGTTVPTFEIPSYVDEYRRCQRYWQSGGSWIAGYNVAGNGIHWTISLPVLMRINPTMSFGGTVYSNASGLAGYSATAYSLGLTVAVTATGQALCDTAWYAVARL